MEINPAMLSQALLNGGQTAALDAKPQGIQTNFDRDTSVQLRHNSRL